MKSLREILSEPAGRTGGTVLESDAIEDPACWIFDCQIRASGSAEYWRVSFPTAQSAVWFGQMWDRQMLAMVAFEYAQLPEGQEGFIADRGVRRGGSPSPLRT